MDFEKGQGEMKLKGNLREIRSRKKIKMGRVWQCEEGGGRDEFGVLGEGPAKSGKGDDKEEEGG